MKKAFAALAAVFMAAGCAAAQSNAPDAALPPPAVYERAPAPQGEVAAPGISIAPPAPVASREEERSGEITVPGQVEQQVPPPQGDPRTAMQRMEDIRAWDRCVMRVQGVGESNPTRPVMDHPEELCARELGMTSRTAVPARRLDNRQR